MDQALCTCLRKNQMRHTNQIILNKTKKSGFKAFMTKALIMIVIGYFFQVGNFNFYRKVVFKAIIKKSTYRVFQ